MTDVQKEKLRRAINNGAGDARRFIEQYKSTEGSNLYDILYSSESITTIPADGMAGRPSGAGQNSSTTRDSGQGEGDSGKEIGKPLFRKTSAEKTISKRGWAYPHTLKCSCQYFF